MSAQRFLTGALLVMLAMAVGHTDTHAIESAPTLARVQKVRRDIPSSPSEISSTVTPSGANFAISTNSGGAELGGKPAIASDGVNFLLVWRDPRNSATNGNDIYGARVTLDGTVLDPNGIPISTFANYDPNPGNQYIPSVAFDGTNYMVVWVENRAPAPDVKYEIYGARVDSNGTVLDPDGFQITVQGDPIRMPSIAFDGTNYLIVWRTAANSIYGIRVSKTGVRQDGPQGFLIYGCCGYYPYVAFDGTNYMVVWHANGATDWDVVGARVSKDGVVLDPTGILIANAPQNQEHTSIAFGGTNYLVAWYDWRPNADQMTGSVYAARVSPNGAVLDNPAFKITDYARGQVSPRVGFDGTDYLVVWMVDHMGAKWRQTDVYGRRVSTGGSILEAQAIPASTSYGHQFAPVIGFQNSKYLVAWNESLSEGRCLNGGCIYGQLLQVQSSAQPAVRVDDKPQNVPATSTPSRSRQSATDWVVEASPTGSPLYAIWGFDSSNLYAVGDYGSLHYDGSAWSLITELSGRRQYAVWGSSASSVWTAGWCWDIFHLTGQSGSFTNCLDYPIGDYPIAMGMWGADDTHILTVGVEGGFIEYDGINWTKKPSGVAVGLWDVWGTSSTNAYAVGEMGTLLRYDGSNWAKQANIPTIQSLNAIWGSSPSDIFIVGDWGTILHYNGNSWSSQVSNTSEHLFGLWGFNGSNVYAVGLHGTILHYDGMGWQPEIGGSNNSLYDIWGMLDIGNSAYKLWAVGDGGILQSKTMPVTLLKLYLPLVNK